MLVVSLGWRSLPGRSAGWIASGAILGSFLSALGALEDLLDQPATAEGRSLVDSAWTYVDTGGFNVDMSILVDPLSVFMCLVVSGVSFLIHVYSVAYMGGDRGYARYFAYLNFFVFSMLLLVLAANFVLLIVGWAFVGAASYLLISFWYRREHRHPRRHQGVRDQRDRRRRARDRRVPAVQRDRRARLRGRLRDAPTRSSTPTRARSWPPAC